jgi:hypothetical protein
MAHPFSAISTPYQVTCGPYSFWATCAWDALGIAGMLGQDTDCEPLCADCDESLNLSLRHGKVCDDAAVPTRDFWKDIGYTRSTILAFRSEEHVARWCERRNVPRGVVVPLSQCWSLARVWYCDRRSPDWGRKSAQEVQRLFDGFGLTGDFWRVAGQ